MLETSNLACTYTHICSFRKYALYQDLLNFAMQYFLWKTSAFFGKNSTFTQSNSMGVVLEIFSYAFSFCMFLQTMHLESGFRIGHQSEK